MFISAAIKTDNGLDVINEQIKPDQKTNYVFKNSSGIYDVSPKELKQSFLSDTVLI